MMKRSAASSWNNVVVVAIVVVVALTTSLVAASSGAVGRPGDICGMSIDELKSCKAEVARAGPGVKIPTQSRCCCALKLADLTCLCTYSAYLPMFGINPESAMKLPVECNITDSFHC